MYIDSSNSEEYDETNVPADVSEGRGADTPDTYKKIFPKSLCEKFEVYSYRGAIAILAQNFPEQYKQIIAALEKFEITTEMIRLPGGSKGLIAQYVDTLFDKNWQETRISGDLHIKLHHANKKDIIIDEYTRSGFLDGHRIDFLNGRVAFDLEWNSKDQTYDRDLYAFSTFHEAGAIDVGVILTRGFSLDNRFFRSLGKVLEKNGSEGSKEVYTKFGASTTWMGKLLYRLDAGRNGGCPILALGITPNCVIDYGK